MIAHRGNAYYGSPTENSLGAFTSAFASGARWIETDVQFTSDDVPVLMHDSTVDRTTDGTGPVAGHTAAQFTALRMNDGQPAPTLAQALDLIRGHPERRMIMETKAIAADQEPVLLGLLDGLEDQVLVNAFAPRLASIQRLKAANPLLQISLVTYSPVLPVPGGLSGQDMEFSYVNADRVAQLHASGVAVRAWVSNTPVTWRALRDLGVDAVMTNSVTAYVAWAATECSGEVLPADQVAPTVSQDTLADGTTVSGTVQLAGSAGDDVRLDVVSLVVDGAVVDMKLPGPGGAVAFDWDTGAIPNGDHTVLLQARDTSGNLARTPPVTVTVTNVDEAAPTPPGDVSAGWSTPSRVTITWAASTDDLRVTGYRVRRDDDVLAIVGAGARSYVDPDVANLHQHTYLVTALDAAGHESEPGGPVVVDTGDDTPPTAPAATAELSGPDAVSVTWSPATDNGEVAGYRVYRDAALVATAGPTSTSWNDTGLDATTAHRYHVTSRDGAGLESPPSNVVVRSLIDTTAPSTPTGLARTVSAFRVQLTWKPSSDNLAVTAYTVYRGGVSIGTTAGTAFTDAAALPGRTHSYTVRARDAAGNQSAASAAVSATLPADRTAPRAPSGLRATVGATGTRRITLTWTAATDNAGVTSYYLFRGNAKYRLLGAVLTYADTGLTAGTRYTYKVYAIDASGNWSSPTANVSATAR